MALKFSRDSSVVNLQRRAPITADCNLSLGMLFWLNGETLVHPIINDDWILAWLKIRMYPWKHVVVYRFVCRFALRTSVSYYLLHTLLSSPHCGVHFLLIGLYSWRIFWSQLIPDRQSFWSSILQVMTNGAIPMVLSQKILATIDRILRRDISLAVEWFFSRGWLMSVSFIVSNFTPKTRWVVLLFSVLSSLRKSSTSVVLDINLFKFNPAFWSATFKALVNSWASSRLSQEWTKWSM